MTPCAHAPCLLIAPLRMLEVQRGSWPSCFIFVPLCDHHAGHLDEATGLSLLPEGCEGAER